MDFGLGLMGYEGCWDDAAFAEKHGFSTAGFVDSPLLGGDPFICLGLAARATKEIRIGTFLAIPSNRTAATTASAIAAVNRLAPGRTFLGVGTGYTSRNTFGLGPISAARVGVFAADCRRLLEGEEAVLTSGDRERPYRFRHKEGLYVDTDSHIPIYVAADGPKALGVAGREGDGWINTLRYSAVMTNGPEVLASSLEAVKAAARASGRDLHDPYTMLSTNICVLEPGESAVSPRVFERVGPVAMLVFHTYSDNPAIEEHLPPPVRERIETYKTEVLARFDCPPDRIYQEAHRGHLSHLLDGEAAVLTEDIVRMTTLTGTAEELAEHIQALEAAGLKNISVWAPPHLTRETVVSIAEQLMPLLEGAAA
jgi:alkanesulfonate monooxygenase SsuD/methylene tetrahydromethanopterin reductase-like flavin-dependent oxidoreductase (luciferase family)